MFSFRKLVVVFALNLIFFTPLSYADIILYSPTHAENICDGAVGIWTGTGVVSTKILGQKITCQYKGVAHVESTETPYTYKFDVDLTLISGICPESENEILMGQCDPITGNVVLKSPDADLSGSLSPDGKSATLTGTIDIPIKGKKLTANVDEMNLQKQ